MADYNPLDPQEQQPLEPNQGVTPGLADQWRGFLDQPSNRAFLIQAGLQMLQPRPTGQSTLGAIAGAVGAGGEAAGRVQAGEEKRQEQESVQAAREAGTEAKLTAAGAAQQRAEAAMINANTRALFGPGSALGATPTARLNANLRAQNLFHNWVKMKEDTLGLQGEDPLLGVFGVQNKAEAARKWDSDPKFRDKVINYFLTPEVAGSTGQGTFGGVPSGERMIQQARDALTRGADRGQVIRILQQNGVPVPPDL